MLIPTKLKSKLPQILSYPIGAEAISEAFAGAPQFEKFVIWFTPYNFASASDLREARKQNQLYKIFQVSMIHPIKSFSSSKQFIEMGFYKENWEINVYPVPRDLKSIAKKLLLSDALPKAKKWLEIPRTEIWNTGRKDFQVLFKEKEGKIFIKKD